MNQDITKATNSLSIILETNTDQLNEQLQAIQNFQQLINKTLMVDQDYGVIPGTNKPTLLKPGAEKIIMIMRLTSEYEVVEKVEDYDKGFFSYTVKSQLFKNGQLITEGFGLANTKETRHRLNEKDDETNKKVWKGAYQDPYTIANTVLKMAKKRAQVDATLTVGSLSNVFTQDMEDLKNTVTEEQLATMTLTDAENHTLTFGKYKGKTLKEIKQENKSYLKYLVDKSKEAVIRQAAEMVLHPEKIKQPHVSQQPEETTIPPDDTMITKQQLAEIERLSTIIGQAYELSFQEVIERYKASQYRQFNQQTASEFIDMLVNKVANLPYPDSSIEQGEDVYTYSESV